MLPRVPAWYTAVLGAVRIGAVPMPGPNLLTPKDTAYRVTQADAVVAITDAAGAEKVDAIEEELPSLRHRIAWTPAGGPAGWHDLDALLNAVGEDADDLPAEPTRREDPLFLSSPRAPSRTRRWCCTPRSTAWGTWPPRASGTTCARATVTGP